MGDVVLFERGNQSPRSFDPADWVEAIARGGYYSAVLREWVPVRMVPDDFEPGQPKPK